MRWARWICGVVDVQRVDTHEECALPHEHVARIRGQKRVGAKVLVGAPVVGEVRPDQDCPVAQLSFGEVVGSDASIRAGAVDDDRLQVRQPLKWERGQVGAVPESMNRCVDVSAGVAAQMERRDPELGLALVPLAGVVVVEDDID